MSPSRGLEGPLNILDIPIADISIVLRTALAQPAAHDAVLRRLLAAGRRLAKTDAWTEAALLDRLHYKNKNQHRRALYFRRFEEVRRVLRRLQKLRSGDAVDRLASLMKAEGTKRGDATWDRVPHQEHLAGVVYSLRTTAELLKKLRISAAQCYIAFRQLASATLFMPLALAVMGACARLAALSKPWATEALACAEDLAVFAKSIPMKDPKGFGMDSVDAVWRTHAIDNPDPPDDNDALAGAEEDGEEVLVSPIPTLAKILVGSTAEALELSESFFSAKMADGPVPQPEPEPEDAIARHEKGSSAARPPGNKKKKKKKKQDDRDDAALNADEIDAIFGF